MSQVQTTAFGEGLSFIEVEHCLKMTPADLKALSAITGPRNLETLRMVSPRPKAVIGHDDLLVVLRGINFNEGEEPDDMVSIRLWLDNKRIIASQNRTVKSVDVAQEKLPELHSTTDAMLAIIDELFNRIERHIFELDEKVDGAEDAALDDPSQKQRIQILEFRRSVIALRRYLLPQRETLMSLSRAQSPLISEDQRQILTDYYYRSARITDSLDAIRERLGLVQEEIAAIISDAMNQNMYILSIISLIFLPLGFLTGLFGINVGGMPWVESPLGFWLIVSACIIAAAGILAIMKIKKWI